MYVLGLIAFSIGTIVVLLLVVYIKDMVRFIFTVQDFFKNFLSIDKSSSDFTSGLFNYLIQAIRVHFRAEFSMMFFIDADRCGLKYFSITEGKLKNLRDSMDLAEFELDEDLKNQIRIGDIRAVRKIYPNVFFKGFSRDKKLLRRALIIPVVQEKAPVAFFILCFPNIVNYLRAWKMDVFYKKQLNNIVLDMISVGRTRDQNVFSIMMENIRDYAFITADNSMKITTWNKGSELMFGYDSNEMIGRKIDYLISVESIEDFQRAVNISMRKEETKMKILLLDYNKTNLTCEILLKQIKMGDTVMGFYILIKDVSKDEVLKNNMKNKSIINRSIVENARDGIILLNRDDKIIYFNERLKNIAEANIAFLGMDIANVFSRQYSSEIKKKIEELKKNKIDFNFIDVNIGEFWYNIRFFPIKSDEGGYQGVIIFFIDNTIRMKTRKELEEKKEQLEKLNRSFLEHLSAARLMQKNLVPKTLPKNKHFRFDSIYILSDEIGGDFFYVEELKIDRKNFYLVLVADVSGHGVAASMFSVLVKDTFNDFKKSCRIKDDLVPSEFLKVFNKKIVELNIEMKKFITVFFSIIDPSGKTVSFSSAGHPSMVAIRNNESIQFYGIKNSPPIGVFENYAYKNDSMQINTGDKLLFYTDGLLDMFASEDSYVSYFNNFILNNKGKSIAQIKSEIEKQIAINFEKTHYYQDDITVVLCHVL
jgi:sigma-B regulation protein RsbU (phosphoserine phosphatase)